MDQINSYGMELMRKFIGVVDFEIIDNKFTEMKMVDDETAGSQQLLVKLVPSSDADEFEKDLPDFSHEIISIMYALSALSFEGAKPRGYSENDYDETKFWNIGEFLSEIKFRHGDLHVHFDYVHGRAMKTTLDANSKDWTIKISTFDRGRSPEHWIRALQGQSKPKLVASETVATPIASN